MARQRHYKNPTEPGICVFITTTVLDFVPVFKDRVLADVAVEKLIAVCRKEHARLHAFVVMPEHLHLLITLAPTQNASAFAGVLKSKVALAIRPKLAPEVMAKFEMQQGLNRREFWRPSFRGFAIEQGPVFWQKVNYIHLNPLRRELVEQAVTYRWSSAGLSEKSLWTEEAGLRFRLEDLPE